MASWRGRLARLGALLLASARILLGRRFWLVPLLPLAWHLVLAIVLAAGGEAYQPRHAQNLLIAAPLAVLAVAAGVRVIAGELDRRTLEVAYTVPGNARRVWLGKLAAAWLLVVVAGVLLAASTFLFFTAIPPPALYGALQAATVYLVLAMSLGVWLRNEVAGAMVSAAVLAANMALSGFGARQFRLSPFWNPAAALAAGGADPAALPALTLHNRIAMLLVIAGLVSLALLRAGRREALLAAQ